jgi:hypothetical protein
MKSVYIVCSGTDNHILGVYASEIGATIQVNLNARTVHGIDPRTEPLDFSGALMRYGWADRVWWQREVLYD